MKILYKIYHSVFACLTLTLSVGMIYAFSLFIPEITDTLGVSRNHIQFAFTLSIGFLGFGAACFGPLVEKNIKLSAFIATTLFTTGLFLTHLSISMKSLWLLYLGTGVCCGLGEGIAYLCPVKNMILWFSKSRFKGLVMAVSIVSFGFGASLCTYLYKFLYPYFGLDRIFLVLCLVYLVMMTVGSIAIRKPKYAKTMLKNNPVEVDYGKLLTDRYFLKHWLFMFLNISMGLILIGNRKNILMECDVSDTVMITVFAMCGFMNAFGRLLFPFIGDFLRNKLWIIPTILIFETMFMSPSVFLCTAVPVSLILCECGYGGMFAIAPQVLLSQYGNKPLSICHGILLLSWGMASFFAFFCTTLMSRFFEGYSYIPVMLSIVYFMMFLYSLTLKKSSESIIKT